MTTETAKRGRGRPPLLWPRCQIDDPIRGRIEPPRSKLTYSLIRHCRKCSQCEAFHSRRFDAGRWWDAMRGNKTYQGEPCRKCGSTARRVHDGSCYACQAKRRGRPMAQHERPLLNRGRRVVSRAEHYRKLAEAKQAERLVAEATVDASGWKAEGWLYGDGRRHIRVTDTGAKGGGWGMCVDDAQHDRMAPAEVANHVRFYGGDRGALAQVLNELEAGAQSAAD